MQAFDVLATVKLDPQFSITPAMRACFVKCMWEGAVFHTSWPGHDAYTVHLTGVMQGDDEESVRGSIVGRIDRCAQAECQMALLRKERDPTKYEISVQVESRPSPS